MAGFVARAVVALGGYRKSWANSSEHAQERTQKPRGDVHG